MLATGCGYSHVPLFPQEYRTVSVPILENRTAYRDVEFDLTEALIKESVKQAGEGEAVKMYGRLVERTRGRPLVERKVGDEWDVPLPDGTVLKAKLVAGR